MNFSEFDPARGYYRDTTTVELRKTGEDSETSFWDYLTYGTATAATSAAIGMYNTGVAIGELIGISDTDSYIDEHSAMQNLWGDDAADFYGKHQTGVDVAGLIAGSFIPGMAAIRGLRAAQVRGIIPKPMQVSTGLRNPDLVLGSKAVEAAKNSVLTSGTAGLRNAEVRRAYMTGVQQQFMEAAAFDLAFVATQNQNAALNPDDLNYLQSAKQVFTETIPFTFLGGGIGSGIDILRVRGSIKKHVAKSWRDTGKLYIPNIGDMKGVLLGDKMLHIANQADTHAMLRKEINAMAPGPEQDFALQQFNRGRNIIQQEITNSFLDAGVKDAAIVSSLEGLMKSAGEGNLSEVANIVSALSKVERVSVSNLNDFDAFYRKTRMPNTFMEGTSEEIADQFLQRQQQLSTVLREQGLEDFADGVFAASRQLDIVARSARSDAGAAMNARTLEEMPQSYVPVSQDNITLYSRRNAEGAQLFMPDIAWMNKDVTSRMYKTSKQFNEQLGIKFNMTESQYEQYVMLHELGHLKTNEASTVNMIANAEANGMSEGYKALRDMVKVSIRSRRKHWMLSDIPASARNKNENEMVTELLEAYRNFSKSELERWPQWAKYLGTPKELLADGHAYMINPATREMASKEFPNLAAFFNREGALAKTWDDTNVMFNTRTGKTYTSFLPGINDVSLKPMFSKKNAELTVPEMGKKFKLDPKSFQNLREKLADPNFDYLGYDAQWNIYARLDGDELFTNSVKQHGTMNITEDNLPAMEKFVTMAKNDEAFAAKSFDQGRVQYNGEVVSLQKLERTLLQRKSDLQLELATMSPDIRPNEHHVAKVLNMDVERAMGFNEGDLLLYGTKDFTKPELLRFAYQNNLPVDYEQSAINLASTMARQELLKEQRQRVSALLLGDNYSLMDDIPTELLSTVAPTDTRAGMVTALRTQMGSLRERAQYVGKILNRAISNKIKEVNDSYVGHANFFNRADNQGARFELANIDNLIRRKWYYPAKFTMNDGTVKRAIVDKHELANHIKQMEEVGGESIGISKQLLDNLSEEDFNALSGARQAGDPSLVEMSDNVARFYDQHQTTNMGLVDKKREYGAVRGREPVLDDLVLYPPPRDLRTSRYHSFVVPTEFQAGSDPRKYMIFAETPGEFEAKKAAIMKQHGNKYRVVTQEQATEFKMLKGDYDKDLVFDEIFFDSSLQRQGTASEMMPNVDIETSATLDRYRQWTIRQEEALLRSGVELRYDDVVGSLKQIDREMGSLERAAIDKRWKEPDTIWKDTLSIMTDQKSYGGAMENLFTRVNDYIGERGSKVIDGAVSIFRKPAGVRITQEDLNKFNADLAKAGYQSPIDDAVEAMMVSPKTTQSSTLPQVVRTMSNLVSTLMLRMDFAHSFIQLASTPILALPVIQEAKQALRGTPQGKQLEAMTGVINPSTNVYEPSAMKLFKDGTTAFWTQEGREFMTQLRERNIVTDYMIQYLDTLDFSTFNGAHTLQHASQKIDNLAKYASRFSGFKFSEEFTRFQVAWATKKVGELRGLKPDEMWSTISSSVDKVHGVYMGNQRVQLFQGVLGQSVGLFQTYFFNFTQNMLKFVQDGNRRQAATMAAMQSSIFGIQSWPGFNQLNQMIGETNRDNHDLYSLTGANDPRSNSIYAMYGLASHAFGFPIDFYTRGDLALRHPTVVPTDPAEFPVIGTMSKAIGNLYNTAKLAFDGDVPTSQALIHGFAHNGMNRPVQGLANIARNRITSNTGQVNFEDSNFLDYDSANELNWGAMFARVIGTRPLNESVIMNEYYRQRAYDANTRRNTVDLSKKVQMNVASGTVDRQRYSNFANEYERGGGDIQNFNSYYMRQLRQSQRPVMQEFYREMQRDSNLSRARSRIESRQNAAPIWNNDPAVFSSPSEEG